jgi:hypothetical protein
VRSVVTSTQAVQRLAFVAVAAKLLSDCDNHFMKFLLYLQFHTLHVLEFYGSSRAATLIRFHVDAHCNSITHGIYLIVFCFAAFPFSRKTLIAYDFDAINMTFSLGELFLAILLCVNGVAVLNEERFLRKCM